MARRYKIKKEDEKTRLDRYLSTVMPKLTRSHLQTLIKDGHITVNDIVVKTGCMLKEDDTISVTIPVEQPLDLEPVDLDLDLLYQDDDIIIVNKPQGLVVHPAETVKSPTLVHGLLSQADHLSAINGVIRPGIVHRIDKDTSGLLVVAKHDEAHRILSDMLSRHEVKRDYLALVYGHFSEQKGIITAPIGRHHGNRLKMAVVQDGRHAVTHFEVLEAYGPYTLLNVTLETGRTHQIRVHMAHIGHPVVGDPLYGPKKVIGEQGQFLHAYRLSFIHPIKKEHMAFEADMPIQFKTFLEQFR
ncbi:MAG: RluA family pseudouridine synthase [Acholeplasmataceae bacterium]|nr:RluA family pseudouridine synthase [Acholeplasmataceae bacterium]